MISGGFSPWDWLVLVQHELLLFAGVFFIVGALDELTVDFAWLWLRLRGPLHRVGEPREQAPATGGNRISTVFIAAWQEERVIGATLQHMRRVWPQEALRIYVGCYRNDAHTIEAVRAAAGNDPRIRLVIHQRRGPTTKADCLNCLYAALERDEVRGAWRATGVVIHDAEDMVDPAALALIDYTLEDGADLVQLPVLPLPQPHSRWIGSHYVEEFAEAHGKALVVRDALRAGIPLAGVGCGIAREALARLAQRRGGTAPFASECLTEDYELGLGIAEMGGRTRFVRRRAADGTLIATRAYFPDRIDTAVRQKTRWVYGIAFQGWDRLGWSARPAEAWMRLRDRRGPFAALVLVAAYLVLLLATVGWLLSLVGLGHPLELSPALQTILAVNFASLAWRCAFRFGFTAREYGAMEGLRAVLRLPVANVIAIMAGRRAAFDYVRSFFGRAPRWDKTEHHAHPAMVLAERAR